MSQRSFVNALIGLAREVKKVKNRVDAMNRDAERRLKHGPHKLPAYGHAVTAMLLKDGYFGKAESVVFGDALEGLLLSYKPKLGTVVFKDGAVVIRHE